MIEWRPARMELGRSTSGDVIKIPTSLAVGYGLGFVAYFPASWAASALRLPKYSVPLGVVAVGVLAGAATKDWNVALGTVSAGIGLYLLELAGKYLLPKPETAV